MEESGWGEEGSPQAVNIETVKPAGIDPPVDRIPVVIVVVAASEEGFGFQSLVLLLVSFCSSLLFA